MKGYNSSNSHDVPTHQLMWRIIMCLIAVFATIVLLSPPKKGMFEDVADAASEPAEYKSCEIIGETESGVVMVCLKR